MKSIRYLKPEYPENAFEGTADYYLKFRIPYPRVLIDSLINHIKPEFNSVLLDLGCGPGRLTFPLSAYFSKVIAIDRDKEMVNTGMESAGVQEIENIEWITGKAEDLEIAQGSIDLITMGDAFHRLDQSYILNMAYNWIKPGGNIAIVGMYSMWRGNEKWHKFVSETIEKWTSLPPLTDINDYQDYKLMLEDKRFIETNNFSFEVINVHNIDSIVGYLFSTSRCSKKLLGNNAENFEKEIREGLQSLNSTGIFEESIKCGYTIGRKRIN